MRLIGQNPQFTLEGRAPSYKQNIWRATRRRGRESQRIINWQFSGRDGARPSNFDVVPLPISEGSALSWPSRTTKKLGKPRGNSLDQTHEDQPNPLLHPVFLDAVTSLFDIDACRAL